MDGPAPLPRCPPELLCLAMWRSPLEKNTSFNIDNALGHPPFIGDLHPNIKVVFLPSDTISLIKPMDQEVRAAFKAYYMRRTFAHAIAETEEDTDAIPEGL